MKRKGFSLPEVLIALLIVSVIMAASAPLIVRHSQFEEDILCHWIKSYQQDGIIYFSANQDSSVGIGLEPSNKDYILNLQHNSDNSLKHGTIAFYDKNSNVIGSVGFLGKNIFFGNGEFDGSGSDNVVIGKSTTVVSGSAPSGKNNNFMLGPLTYSRPLLIGKWTASNATFEGGEEYNYVFNSGVQQNYLANSGYLVIKGKLIIDSNLSSQDYNDSSVSTLPNLSCDAAKIRNLVAENLNTYNNTMYQLYVGTTLYVGEPGDGKVATLDLSNAKAIKFNQDINVLDSPFVLNSEFETLKGTVDDIKANYEALTQEQEASPSDLRLKNVIGDSKYGLNELRQISVKDYIFKKDDKKTLHTGVVAQELREVFPNLVEQDKEGYLFIKPMELLYVAINAIKQIDLELKQLKESFGEKSDKEALEAENQKMKKEIKRLKKENEKIVRRLEKIEQYMKQ